MCIRDRQCADCAIGVSVHRPAMRRSRNRFTSASARNAPIAAIGVSVYRCIGAVVRNAPIAQSVYRCIGVS
eukprot:12893936-Alexandrium_andersonii.AAC.1